MNEKVALIAGDFRFALVPIVKSLLRESATVIVPAKSAQEIARLKECLVDINTGNLVTLLIDYPDYDNASEVVESISEQFGKIDLAVICFDAPQSTCGLTETRIMDWERMIDHNITAFFIAARVVLWNMKANRHGMFISISNTAHAKDSRSVLADLSSGMQTEMAKLFSEEAKGCNIKCHHLTATHFTTSAFQRISPDGKDCAEDNSMGNFIIRLFNGETGDAECLLRKLSVNAMGDVSPKN